MPMIRSCNRDGVYVFLLENPAKIFLRNRCLAHLALGSVGEFREYAAVHVADMRDAGPAAVRLQRGEMSVPPAIQTDHSEGEAAVGTDDLAMGFFRRRHAQGG